jgi:alkylresorcinol/alkylpyrone synthase
VFHPGGPSVADALEKGLSLPRLALGLSRRVLARVGNLSSATVVLVLDELLRSGQPRSGDHALLLAPGPGFAIEQLLARFDGGRSS